MWKVVGPVNVKKIYAKCEKKFGQLHDQSNGQFGQFGQLFFSAFSGFGVSTFQKLKILGSVMIFRESVKWNKQRVGGLGKLLGFEGGK